EWVARFADITAGESRRLAPGARPAIEDMLPDLRDLGEQWCPAGSHVIGMIMSRFTDRRIDEAGQRVARDLLGLGPRAARGGAIKRAVANEGELADVGARTLVDHAANRFREGGVAHPVEHDLCYRLAALDR